MLPLAVAVLLIQAIPQGREAGTAPYDPFAGRKPAEAEHAMPAEPPPPKFRITVPMCRQAEKARDPLAETPECTTLLKAAEEQAKDCKKAFEDGDDAVVLSAGCRQAAGFR
jgi:hypothetical protein